MYCNWNEWKSCKYLLTDVLEKPTIVHIYYCALCAYIASWHYLLTLQCTDNFMQHYVPFISVLLPAALTEADERPSSGFSSSHFGRRVGLVTSPNKNQNEISNRWWSWFNVLMLFWFCINVTCMWSMDILCYRTGSLNVKKCCYTCPNTPQFCFFFRIVLEVVDDSSNSSCLSTNSPVKSSISATQAQHLPSLSVSTVNNSPVTCIWRLIWRV